MKERALRYHDDKKPGKLAVIPTKPCTTPEDLSLAYSPGVAYPCLEIKEEPGSAYKYTSKGNLVAVISNGTAVLGLGNIGALASKPVMEGKGVLFKRFADVDVFDLEVDESDPERFIGIVEKLAPSFGGINLEDIKAPECFYIEEELKKKTSIPVFHDDQHGTAIIVAAAMKNALDISGKDLTGVKIVVSGAGAASIAITRLLVDLGAGKENISMFDSKGLLTKDRDINKYKMEFARDDAMSLADAMKGADVFIGVSAGGLVTKEMVTSMGEKPIVFALANPDPEITYEDAKQAAPDVIMATGRSDYPNQVNNVLCFPFIFRGALDVGATHINHEMKIAAVDALSRLAREEVPESVKSAYSKELKFGNDYIIPAPFDPRVLCHVAPAVAKAAMDSGVARAAIEDLESYTRSLAELSECLSKGNFCDSCLINRETRF